MKSILFTLTLSLTIQGALADEAFRKVCQDKIAEANGNMTIHGEDGWLFLNSELRHVAIGPFWGEAAAEVGKASKPEWRDPLPAMVDFHKSLNAEGIELLLVPVPPKAAVYPRKLEASLSRKVELALDTFYPLLSDQGMQVLDLKEAFGAAEGHYCKQDSHWSGRGCELAAKKIVEFVKERDWFKAAPRETYASEIRPTEITGDLLSTVQGDPPAKETLPLRYVGKHEGDVLRPVAPDASSPVLLLGDSHTLVFHAGGDMHAKGAGLADQLALQLGFAVDLIGVRGSGATPARINLFRKSRSNADYLKGKKLVIWCFTAREFSEASSGWRKVPVK